jgi:hypothetical protein
MKKALRVVLPILMICLFGFLYLFFGSLEKIADTEVAKADLRDQIITSMIENVCRDEGQVLACFETTKDECIAEQKNAVSACMPSSARVADGKTGSELFIYSAEVAGCAVDNFVEKHKGALRTEIDECRKPDPSKLIEAKKLFERFSDQLGA